MIRFMDLAAFSADLDAQPWAGYQHAYGSAADVPDCLRALAGDDEDEASEALSELYGSILHQGSVYEATARAVPYLGRLAGAGFRTGDLLFLLGGIAESGTDDGDGAARGGADDGDGTDGAGHTDEATCRAAVLAQLPVILPAVDDEKAGVRLAAVWAAARTEAAANVCVPRRGRWRALKGRAGQWARDAGIVGTMSR